MKLEIDKRKIAGKFLNTQRSNNKLLNITWNKREILREVNKYFELNENMTFNMCGMQQKKRKKEKKIIALNTYNRKEDLKSII